MICLCNDCQPDEDWLEGAVNWNGILTFYDDSPETGCTEIGSCSAFIIEDLINGKGGIAMAVVRFVTVHSIAKDETKAFGRVPVPLREIYIDPDAALSRLADGGFYVGTPNTSAEIVDRIRWAIDCLIFTPRRENIEKAA